MKNKQIATIIGFCCGTASLTTVMFPALSFSLAILGIITSVVGLKAQPRHMAYAGLGMSILALVIDLIYLILVL